MKRPSLDKLRAQAQLVRAQRPPRDTRQRAIQWLRKKQETPPTVDVQADPSAPGATAVQQRATPAVKAGRRAERRAPQPQDTLGKLLKTDATSQKYAEQLHWKFTQYYIPAKRLDIQRRRGLTTAGDVLDAEDVDDS